MTSIKTVLAIKTTFCQVSMMVLLQVVLHCITTWHETT